MSQIPPTSSNPGSKQERLRQYLRRRVDAGDRYFKSKFIATEIDLSPKEIGAMMVQLCETAEDLRIEKWSYTNATTWRVKPI